MIPAGPAEDGANDGDATDAPCLQVDFFYLILEKGFFWIDFIIYRNIFCYVCVHMLIKYDDGEMPGESDMPSALTII